MINQVPTWPLKVLRWFCRRDRLDEIEGDLLEAYNERVTEHPASAHRKLWLEVIQSFKWTNIGIMDREEHLIVRRMALFLQYTRVLLRTMNRARTYTTISVLSLTLGIVCATLIFMYVFKERQYDRFYTDAERIYRVATVSETTDRSYGFAPLRLTPHLLTTQQGVENGVRIFRYRREIPVTLQATRQSFNEPGFAWCDPSFFEIFDIEMLQGTASALDRPHTVVISESTAQKYFGGADPIGQIIEFTWADTSPLEVAGVYRDFPSHSHLSFDLLSSLETCQRVMWPRPLLESWQNLFTSAYLKLKSGVDPHAINGAIQQALNEHFQPDTPNRLTSTLQPLTSIHLHSNLQLGEWKANNTVENLWMFGTIGLILLCLGSFNFVNMMTAQAGHRAKEVGIRKIFGSQSRQIAQQTYFETAVFVGLAVVSASLLVWLLVPTLERLTEHTFRLEEFLVPSFYLPVLGYLALLVLLSGMYPAFFISRISSLSLMRRSWLAGPSGGGLRNALVLTQFCISIGLVISTAVVYRQLDYMRNKDLGFQKDLMLTLPIHNDEAVIPRLETFKQMAMTHPGVRSITAASHELFADYTYFSQFRLEGMEEPLRWERYTVDEDYVETFGLQLVAGRSFSKQFAGDSSAFVLNETAVKAMGREPWEVIGKTMINETDEVTGKIVGVVRDFHYRSLHTDIQPFVLNVNRDRLDYVSVRLGSTDFQESLIHLEASWEEVFGEGVPFFYSFLDQKTASMYRAEASRSLLFSAFSATSMVLGCLGLFGLALFITHRKTREIGIRKVLGAGAWRILSMLNARFLGLVGLAFVVAAPVAYLLMDEWLSSFAYRISQPIWVYAGAGLITLLVSSLTVGYLSWRAAQTNPVETIRME